MGEGLGGSKEERKGRCGREGSRKGKKRGRGKKCAGIPGVNSVTVLQCT